MLASENPCLQSAYLRLQVSSQDEDRGAEYKARMKALRDHNRLAAQRQKRGPEYDRAWV